MPSSMNRVLPYALLGAFLVVFLLDLFVITPFLLQHFDWARSLNQTPTLLAYSHRRNALSKLMLLTDLIMAIAIGYGLAVLFSSRTKG